MTVRKVLGLWALVLIGFGGCSTHPAVVDMEGIEEFPVGTKPLDGKVLGEVRGRHRAYLWEGCSYAARTAVWKMIREAKEMGAGAIGDVYWRDGRSPEPRCKMRWFYVLIPPMLITPYFLDAEVRGTAYATAEPSAGLYEIPSDPADVLELAERIVAESGCFSCP